MHVPSYQMHNVLNVYSKQLRQNLASTDIPRAIAKLPEDRVNLTSEVNRQTMIEKVSKEILNKISSYGSCHNSLQQKSEQLSRKANPAVPPADVENQRFVFNAIDAVNNKRQNALSVDDSSFLIKRLDQLAKQAGDQNPKPGI